MPVKAIRRMFLVSVLLITQLAGADEHAVSADEVDIPIPEPTDANMIKSPFWILCSGYSFFKISSYKVGIVATELFPSLFILIGIIPLGISFCILYNL